MQTISKMIKENKLFTGKVFNKLQPREKDALEEIIKFTDEDKVKEDFMTKMDKWIDICCEKHNIDKNRMQNIIDDQINESVGEII